MIEIRKLAREEYGLLSRIADGYTPDASASIAVVAFDGTEPIGRMLVVAPAHVEGTWIAERARFGTVGQRLYQCVEQEARGVGLTQLLAFSTSGAHDAYMHRLGFERLPWTVWRKKL